MSRIEATFARAKAEGRIAFMPFMTVGYPDYATSVALVRGMVDAGADAIELGIPFSDPLADGPTVQKASMRALEQGTTPKMAIDAVRTLREAGVEVPLILMGYFNSLLAYGVERMISDAAAAGADGFIVVDLPPEESDETLALCRKAGLDLIYLVAPTSDGERIAEVTRRAGGFIYCVGVVGVTSARDRLADDLPAFIARLRAKTDLPLAVGFGISKRAHVEALQGVADAAIVGSAVIEVVESSPREERVKRVRDYVEVLTGRTEASV
ncbi:MAG TPA: tryptophan synthase subunit alpha [Dehalococcoidia bacterium]|nr:tryptophan synthase subunit alpha [Dehalococcoidia bacterium]